MCAEESKSTLRLVLVIDEEGFHHPQFVDELIQKSPHALVGALRVVKPPPQSNVMGYLKRNIYRFRIDELIKYAFKLSWWTVRRLLGAPNSVAAVLKLHRIPYIDVSKNINTAAIRQQISDWSPDVLISSNSLYFGKRILAIPRLGCINRHTALLPAYGGILPLFHALANREPQVGVTIHRMTQKIDSGSILAQAVVDVLPDDTMETLFKRCFARTVPLVLEAIGRLADPKQPSLSPRSTPSYFSFPNKSTWKNFRQAKRRLV